LETVKVVDRERRRKGGKKSLKGFDKNFGISEDVSYTDVYP